MLRNRLAELLSERRLKITQVAKDTGISRNTITATAQNDNKMIQYETIDILCQYLRIEPKDFFEYEPISYKFHIEIIDLNLDTDIDRVYNFSEVDVFIEFDFFIDLNVKGKKYSFNLESSTDSKDAKDFLISVNFESISDIPLFEDVFYDKISAGLQVMFNESAKNFIVNEITNELNDLENEIFASKNFTFLFDWELPF